MSPTLLYVSFLLPFSGALPSFHKAKQTKGIRTGEKKKKAKMVTKT
jgi:hypothetical protein